MVLNLFKIYILGLFQFGLPIWRVQCAKSAWDQLDATFTKYLKSYLGVPKHSNNAIVHHLCETIPFSVYMKNRIQESISVLSYPKEFNGIKLSLLQDEDSRGDYNNHERIPSWFWLGPTYENLPLNKNYRKRLCSSLLDFNHKELCSIETFHIPNEECRCKFCNDYCSHFHERYCLEMT